MYINRRFPLFHTQAHTYIHILKHSYLRAQLLLLPTQLIEHVHVCGLIGAKYNYWKRHFYHIFAKLRWFVSFYSENICGFFSRKPQSFKVHGITWCARCRICNIFSIFYAFTLPPLLSQSRLLTPARSFVAWLTVHANKNHLKGINKRRNNNKHQRIKVTELSPRSLPLVDLMPFFAAAKVQMTAKCWGKWELNILFSKKFSCW